MKVNMKCFSSLVNTGNCGFKDSTIYELQSGQTVIDLLNRAGIPDSEVKIAFVNSRIVGLDTVLTDGDQVGLSPAVGGM